MPPKKANQPSKKTIEKQKTKVIEDKTFGLKNKKGAKTQKFIAQVEKQVQHGGKSGKELDKARLEKGEKKDMKEKELEELNMLFRPVAEIQKVAAGVDPKSVLCVFFKQGTCTKGAKCKFSHDKTIERKAEKRNIYETNDSMNTWDQEKLEDVVSKKHGATNVGLPPTTIICKHFLDALENNKYGWFWECPNGQACHYRHALPPGFMLKKDEKKMEEQKEIISLEELIEKERQNLGMELVKVTWETFMAWKIRKREEKLEKMKAEKEKRHTDFKQGRTIGLSGRDLFEFNPELARDQMDDEEGGDVVDSKLREKDENDEWEGHVQEIDFSNFETHNGVNHSETQILGAQACNVDIDTDLFDDPDLVEEIDALHIDDEDCD